MNSRKVYLTVQDFSVSKETFELLIDSELDILITSPIPEPELLGRYYESDEYISHTSNRRTIIEKAYHLVRGISVRRKVDLISRYNSGSLLDIGAGTGDFLAEAQARNWKTIGIEPNPGARTLAEAKGVRFEDVTSSIADSSFDVITMWHVLEHVPDYEGQIQELKRLLKPDGTIIIAVPNFKSYDARHYGKYWAAYDVPRHLWHFSKSAIDKIFSANNLKVIDVKPLLFDSFYVSLLSEKYKTGKMNYIKAMYIGLKSNLLAIKTTEYSSRIYIIKKAK